jgi:hypothetical protein
LGDKIRRGVIRGYRVVARGWGCGCSLRRYRASDLTVEFPVPFIRCFGFVPWFSHYQLQVKQSWNTFGTVSYWIHARAPLHFWLAAGVSLRGDSGISWFFWVIL